MCDCVCVRVCVCVCVCLCVCERDRKRERERERKISFFSNLAEIFKDMRSYFSLQFQISHEKIYPRRDSV